MIITEKRKKSVQDLNQAKPINIPKIENNNSLFYHSIKNNFRMNKKTDSYAEKNNKYSQKTVQFNYNKYKHPPTNYNNRTLNHFQISSNNLKKIEEYKSKKIKEIIFPKINQALKNKYNLSDINMSNSKTLEKAPSLIKNLKSFQKNKNNQESLNINIDYNNKFLIDEKLNRNKKYQTKTHNIKMKILQNNKSQDNFKNNLFNKNTATPPLRNHNSFFFSDNSKKNNIEHINVASKNNYNNHKLYESNNIKKNNNRNNKFKNDINTKNNIIQNKRDSNSKEKENNKKDNKRFKTYNKSEQKDDSDNIQKNQLIIKRDAEKMTSGLLNINPFLKDFGQKKPPIFLSPEILTGYHNKFRPSYYSFDKEFSDNDFIKAYSYNTCEGNVRNYNEDTITAKKIYLDSKLKSNYFYYFAVYDGHGGKGCSKYLQNNLHKKIKEFSIKGIKDAIDETEKNFLENVAVINGDLKDHSGSCAIMVLLKDRKCIIANIGDSRCILFKNKRLTFSTKDHKQNSYIEKRRIELAGGSIYHPKAITQIYQNGKLIEIPWRVSPGGLSVSRTFGDIESKDLKFGGKKGVVAAIPDITEFELNENFNFMVIGCDGIFDVLSNNEILECIKIVLKSNENKNKKINHLCGHFATMIIKSELAKESFDNVSCIVVIFNINELI